MKSSTPSHTIWFILCVGILMLMNCELYSLVLCSFLKIVWIMKFFCTDSIFFFYCALQLGGLLIPQRGIKPVPSAVSVES